MVLGIPFDLLVDCGVDKSLIIVLFAIKESTKKKSLLKRALYNRTINNLDTICSRRKHGRFLY